MRTAATYLILAFLFFTCAKEDQLKLSELPRAEISDLTDVYSIENLNNRDVTFRDNRLLTMRHTDSKYEMPQYRTKAEWEKRSAYIRDQVLVSAGLYPLPEKTPLNAHIFGLIEREDYTVEKVYFESHPGFYVTGNLYRPKGKEGPFPGILSAIGHWGTGRLTNTELGSIPGRCINFARQGYVAFTYDMVGYNDSKQIDHKFAMDSLSQVWGVNLLGLQLWNSIRSLDFLTSLPDVDANRIAVTGASGGGSQTFLLTAVDDQNRIKAVAPVNMISAHFQGGSWCENAPGLRHNIFNVEIGAAAVPRPLLLVSDTYDWTVNTPMVEYPMTMSIYRLYDAAEKLKYVQFDALHNYHKASREAVYSWFGRWILGEEDPSRLKEKAFEVEKDEDLLAFPDLKAPGDMDAAKLTEYLKNVAINTLQSNWPKDENSLNKFKEIYGTAYAHVLSAETPENVSVQVQGRSAGSDYMATRMLLSRSGKNDWIPAIWYQPVNGSKTATLVVSSLGKAALVSPDRAEPVSLVKTLLEKGQNVLAIDVFKTGEHILQEGAKTQRDESFRYFTTFNRTDTQERIQDILTALSFLKNQQAMKKINLVGADEAGPWTILASAVADELIDQVIAYGVNLNHNEDSEALKLFVPGLSRIGGVQTAIALYAPKKVIIHNIGDEFDPRKDSQVYQITGYQDNFKFYENELSMQEIVELLGP